MTQHKLNRLTDYDYAQPNAYVFTVVTQDRQCWLGTIVDLEFRASPAGAIVSDAWISLPEKFPSAVLDAFVVMPNHIHGIVFLGANPYADREVAINGDATGWSDLAGRFVEQANSVASPFMATITQQPTFKSGPHSPKRQPPTPPSRNPLTPALGEIIRSLKAASTTQIRKIVDSTFAWQPNYWDRIIRNDGELDRYRTYIENNPARWEEDKEYLKGEW
jgi:REP element-mobilizing transposase RayT